MILQRLKDPGEYRWRGESVVCGTDFSEKSLQAEDVASAIASCLKRPLILVHSLAESFREEVPIAAIETLMQSARERLEREAERVRTSGCELTPVLLKGVPDDGLAKFVAGADPQIVVVGASEHVVLGRILTGNVAEMVAEASPVPTLVIHSATRIKEWIGGQSPLNVLVALDHSAESESAVEWIQGLRAMGEIRLAVAHVLRSGTPDDGETSGRALKTLLQATFKQEPGEIHILRSWYRTHQQILDLLNITRSDLLVAGTHQRHGIDRLWHASVSRALLRHSPVSVACVPIPVASMTRR